MGRRISRVFDFEDEGQEHVDILGTITAYDEEKETYTISYDDGSNEEAHIPLNNSGLKILNNPGIHESGVEKLLKKGETHLLLPNMHRFIQMNKHPII